jgi:REP element-mobilizing transposase RayT
MSHSFTNLLYHIVFATKEREPWLDEAWRPDLFAYIGGVVRAEGGLALEVNGYFEHVHIFAWLHADHAIAPLLRAVKAKSSFWVHKNQRGLASFAWQTGYAAFTVSQSGVEAVRAYVRNQPVRHQKMPFLEEWRELLRLNGLDPDEKVSWA